VTLLDKHNNNNIVSSDSANVDPKNDYNTNEAPQYNPSADIKTEWD